MNYIDAINLMENMKAKNKSRFIICLTETDDNLVREELANRGYTWISGADLRTKTYFDRYGITSYGIGNATNINKYIYREEEKYFVKPYKENHNYFEEKEEYIVVGNRIMLHDEDAFLKLLE